MLHEDRAVSISILSSASTLAPHADKLIKAAPNAIQHLAVPDISIYMCACDINCITHNHLCLCLSFPLCTSSIRCQAVKGPESDRKAICAKLYQTLSVSTTHGRMQMLKFIQSYTHTQTKFPIIPIGTRANFNTYTHTEQDYDGFNQGCTRTFWGSAERSN